MLTIIIQESSQNINVEKKFSPFCTVSQVLDWCCTQFFNQLPTKKDNGKEYWLLQYKGRWMQLERCLFSFGLEDHVRFFFKKTIFFNNISNKK